MYQTSLQTPVQVPFTQQLENSKIKKKIHKECSKQQNIIKKKDLQINNVESEQSTKSQKFKSLNINRIAQLIRQKNYKALVGQLKNDSSRCKYYPKVQYQNKVYHLNQDICIQSTEKFEYVAKLKKIINLIDDNNNCIPVIKVHWYYRKQDLQSKFPSLMSIISENEVFLTNLKDIIEVETILSEAQVITFEEYDKLDKISPGTFFTRASYNIQTNQLEPSFDKWRRQCICNVPPNPDFKYIQCENCLNWFHLECLQIKEEELDIIEKYQCRVCKLNTSKN